jgi:N-glycosylase/DNA lyase
MIQSLKNKYGTKLYSDPELGEFFTFPSFESLKSVKVDELNKMGFGYRSKYIRGTMDILEEKGLNWLNEVIQSETPSDILTTLPGVGRKVADCISLFACGKFNVVPIDVHMFKFYNENLNNFTGEKYKKIESISSKNNYLILQKNLQAILGSYAGWIHSMFFLERLDSKFSNQKKIQKRPDPELEFEIEKKSNKKGKKK